MRTTGDGGFVFFHKDERRRLGAQPASRRSTTSSPAAFSLGAHRRLLATRPRRPGRRWLDLGARAGFNLNINDNVGFWPSAGLSVQHDNIEPQLDDVRPRSDMFAPFLYHLVPHLFVGLGPSFAVRLSGGGRQQLRRRFRPRRLAVER